ncbi:GIY-YIG nuclease family protein [Niabella sp.]|uniref:GIY-YIG nuclease family protein n=1 Tax=Niabella sp. TaxID=1962976 RepID=UPI003451C9DB
MFYVYILHSPAKNKYYIGFTGDNLQERLRRHNANHKGFTGTEHDWVIVYYETFGDKSSAMNKGRAGDWGNLCEMGATLFIGRIQPLCACSLRRSGQYFTKMPPGRSGY